MIVFTFYINHSIHTSFITSCTSHTYGICTVTLSRGLSLRQKKCSSHREEKHTEGKSIGPDSSFAKEALSEHSDEDSLDNQSCYGLKCGDPNLWRT